MREKNETHTEKDISYENEEQQRFSPLSFPSLTFVVGGDGAFLLFV